MHREGASGKEESHSFTAAKNRRGALIQETVSINAPGTTSKPCSPAPEEGEIVIYGIRRFCG